MIFFSHIYLLSSFWASCGHRCRPFFPPVLTFNFLFFIAHRVQQSHCSSIFHRVLPTRALALSASQFEHEKKSQRIYTSMHSGGFELTKKLTYTRLEDNLIRHRGDRLKYTGRINQYADLLIVVFFLSGLTWYIPGLSRPPTYHRLLPLLADWFCFSLISSFTFSFRFSVVS